jgi:hypothetical protein
MSTLTIGTLFPLLLQLLLPGEKKIAGAVKVVAVRRALFAGNEVGH